MEVRQTATRSRDDVYWESPDASAAVHISGAAIDSLKQAMARLESDLPVRGAELGGLLFGRLENTSRLEFWIERLETVSPGTPRGPSWKPNADSVMSMAATIGAVLKSGDTPLGIFRSHTRKDLFLDEGDAVLRRTLFADGPGIFLVVKPFLTREAEGGIQVWKQSGRYAGSELGHLELGRIDFNDRHAPPRPTPLPIDFPVDPGLEPQSRRGLQAIGILAICLLGAIGYWKRAEVVGFAKSVDRAFHPAVVYRPTVVVNPPAKLDVASLSTGLQAQFQMDRIAIRWNAAAPVLQGARIGKITIVEGAREKSFVLGPAQFLLGSYSCPREPLTADLSTPPTFVRLEIAVSARVTVSEQAAVTAP